MPKVIKSSHSGASDEPGTGYTGEFQPRRSANIQKKDTIEARGEKHRILAEANATREEILRAAEAEAEALKLRAREDGYNEGQSQAVREVQELVANIADRFQQIEAQIEPQLRELSITIARKIIGKELELKPHAVVSIVKQALSEKARTRTEIYLRVNPVDYQSIRQHKAELVEVLSRCKEIGIREDADVAPNGCIIETDAGSIDAQLETQLEIFERVLMDVAAAPQP